MAETPLANQGGAEKVLVSDAIKKAQTVRQAANTNSSSPMEKAAAAVPTAKPTPAPAAPTPTPQNTQQQGATETGDPNFQRYATAEENTQNGHPEDNGPGTPAPSNGNVDPNNPLANTPEYQMQQALNKPVLDYFDNQKELEGQKLVDTQKLLDSQQQQDNLLVNDQINSIQSNSVDNMKLLGQQKEVQQSILDEEKKTRQADAADAKADAELEYDRAIRDRQKEVIQQEAQSRTALGLTGGFGSQARLDYISDAVSKGNDMVSQLQQSKAKLSVDYGKAVDGIEKDYSTGVKQMMFEYDKNVLSIKKDASDSILAIKKQVLLTKQQRDAKYLEIKQTFFDDLSKIEGNTASLLAQTNKDTYTSIIQAHKDELERQQQAQKDQWDKATKLIDTYGGVNGAILAEKMLGLEPGTLPRVQTVEESKFALQQMQYQSDQYFKGVGMQMDQQKLKLQQDQFNFDTTPYDPNSYDQYSTAPGGGAIGSKPLDTDWSKVPDNIKGNCVLFARACVPDLPVINYSDTSKEANTQAKRAIINSPIPKPGSIAVMPTLGKYGHLAYVESVNPDGTVTLVDANNAGGNAEVLAKGGTGVGGNPGISRRTVNPQEYGIEGYFQGKGALTQPNQNVPYDKNELLGSQNDTTEAPTQKNWITDLASSFFGSNKGQTDLSSTMSMQNNQSALPSIQEVKDAQNKAIAAGAAKRSDFQSKEDIAALKRDPRGYVDALKASVTGGGSQKPLNVQQAQAAGYAVSAAQAEKVLDSVQANGGDVAELNNFIARARPDGLAYDAVNKIKSSNARRIAQSELSWVESVLRPASGAAISAAEYATYGNMYFPRPGDNAQNLADKKASREQRVKNLLFEAGQQGQDYYDQQTGGGDAALYNSLLSPGASFAQSDIDFYNNLK